MCVMEEIRSLILDRVRWVCGTESISWQTELVVCSAADSCFWPQVRTGRGRPDGHGMIISNHRDSCLLTCSGGKSMYIFSFLR